MKNRLGNFFHPNRFPKLRNVSAKRLSLYFMPMIFLMLHANASYAAKAMIAKTARQRNRMYAGMNNA